MNRRPILFRRAGSACVRRALLARAHCPMQARRHAHPCQGELCRTVAPRAFVLPRGTRHVDVDVARSSCCCSASLYSSPSFSPPRYIASVIVFSVSPPSPVTVIFIVVAIVAAILRLLDALPGERNEPPWELFRHATAGAPSL
jgi:hypothetical protein